VLLLRAEVASLLDSCRTCKTGVALRDGSVKGVDALSKPVVAAQALGVACRENILYSLPSDYMATERSPHQASGSDQHKRLVVGWFSFTCCEDSTILFTELLNDWVCPVSTDHSPLSHDASSQSNLLVL
jgi:hypothetical protein